MEVVKKRFDKNRTYRTYTLREEINLYISAMK
jgi:hypothetical protein